MKRPLLFFVCLTALGCGSQEQRMGSEEDLGMQEDMPSTMTKKDMDSSMPDMMMMPTLDMDPMQYTLSDYDAMLDEAQTQVPETMLPETTISIRIALKNTGSAPWRRADKVRLATRDDNQFVFELEPSRGFCLDAKTCRIYLPADIAVGGSLILDLEASAPNPMPGDNVLAFSMIREDDGAFGQELEWGIRECHGPECEQMHQDMTSQDMSSDMPVSDMQDMAPDMPVEMAEYCTVIPQGGLNLRQCPEEVEPSVDACPNILTGMPGGSFVEKLEESPGGWYRIKHLATGLEGWSLGTLLMCPVELPTDTCAPDTSTAERVMACQSALLQQVTRPIDGAELLYYVNRWYSIDKCFPTAPSAANDSAIQQYMEPALTQHCGSYSGINLVSIPPQYASGSRSLRAIAWESPAPSGPMQTYDGKSVGHNGNVGFKAMFDAAQQEKNYEYIVISGFRSATTQLNLFGNYVNREGGDPAKASVYSAKPTHSEHQLGTTADITYIDGMQVNPYAAPYTFYKSPQGRWLVENAHRFGIVTTYEPHKVDVHQYQPEPWHMRFVGVEAADAMKACDLNTEEFLAHKYNIPTLPTFMHMDLVYDRMNRLGYPMCLKN